MAKKIKIQGTGHLHSITDPWGGVNDTDHDIEVYGTIVPAGAEWGMNRDEVERFMKECFGKKKAGAIHNTTTRQQDNFKHTWGFATEADKETYLAALAALEEGETLDEETAALRIFDEPIPINEEQGVNYSARLSTSIVDTTAAIAVTEPVLDVPLRFCGVVNDNGTIDNVGVNGTISIWRSVNGVDWGNPIGTQQLPSRNLDYEGYDSVNIGQYLQEGEYQYRFQASFQYEDSEGVTRTAYSTYITLQRVVYSNMRLTFAAQWQRPFSGDKVNVGFYIQGYGQMFLYVTCDGVTVVNELAVTTSTEIPQDVEISDANLLTNGVHTLRAWLVPAADGSVQSEAVEAQFLYFDEAIATEQEKAKTYIMVNGIIDTVQPYVETSLMQYAVYKYGADTVPLGIRLTNAGRTETYLSHDLGNVPVGVVHTYQNALKIPQGITTAYLYFAVEGTIHTDQYWPLAVDQSIDYNPTTMNADGFYFDPSVRSNNEDHPETVINARTGQAVAASYSESMTFKSPKGYVADSSGTIHLHLDAGDKLNITGYDPMDVFIGPNGATASMTMELDIKVGNVYNEKEPVLRVGTYNNGKILGFEMLPLTAYHLTEQQSSRGSQDVQLQEDERTHVTLNIIYNLGGRGLNFDRIFVNGIINREFIYGVDRFVADGGSGGIVIGSDSADVDIYSIRVYKQALSSQNVLQDYKSSIPDAAKKLKFHRMNDILGGDNTISYAKTSELYSTMLWIPDDITKPYLPNYTNGSQAKYSTGTLKVIFRYRYDGNGHKAGDINYELSRIYTHLKIKGQGTSSMTYWTWNLRFQFTDQSEVWSVNAALNAETLLMMGADCYFIFEENGAHVTKADAKANWASSSQSHKMGMMNAYGALWKQIIGTQSPIYASDPKTRPCVLQEAFMFFVQDIPGTDSSIRFSNFMTFGPAKNDKATWGLGVKSDHYKVNGSKKSMYTCLEGSSNGRELVEGKVPWIPEEVFYFYDPADSGNKMNETFIYNGASHFDFDKGPSNTQLEGTDNEYDVPKGFTYVGDNKWQETEDMEFPLDDQYGAGSGNTIKFYRRAWNLVYLCNPSVEAKECDYAGLMQMAGNGQLEQGKQYFVMNAGQGHAKGDCFRWNPITETWVNGGIRKDVSTEDGYAVLNLFTDLADYMPNSYNPNDAISLTNAFVQARLDRYRAESSLWWHEGDCDLCQAWGKITAAKDNWCKNTYFILNPDGLLSMNRDDDDTILDKDNVGKTGTPYQVEEHDRYNDAGEWADENGHGEVWDAETEQYNIVEDARNTYFNSQDSVLFTLREKTRPELKAMVGTIFQTMVQLEGSVEAFFQKYFFDIQEYFPAVAYNEVARLLYEEAKIQMAAGNYTNNTDPMTQSLGDQLQGEKQWIKRRIPYMESYGNSSVFADANGRGALSFRSSLASTDGGTTHSYVFKVTPHQFLYPSAGSESGYAFSNHRSRPGEVVALPPLTVTQNNNVFIFGIDYLRSVGDFAEHPTEPNSSMSVVGARLTEWTINAAGNQTVQNRSTAMSFSCPKLKRLVMRGHTTLTSLGSDSLSNMTQAEEIDLRGCTGITNIRLPETSKLTTLRLPETITSVALTAQPNLSTFTMEGYAAMESLIVTGSPLVATQAIVMAIYEAQQETQVFTTLTLKDIQWANLPVGILSWMADLQHITVNGTIGIFEDNPTTNAVTFDLKEKFNRKWGNVDNSDSNEHQGLLLSYRPRRLESASVKGNFYTESGTQFPFTIEPNSSYVNAFTKIRWSMSGLQYSQASIDPVTGLLTVESLSNLVDTATITAMITTYYEGVESAMVVSKDVQIYNRKAQLGDYVYHDGTYSSPDTYTGEKYVIGHCCYLAPVDNNGDIVAELFHPEDKQKRLMVARSNVSATGSTESGGLTYSSWQWGAYRNTSLGAADYASLCIHDLVPQEGNNFYHALKCPEANLDGTTFYNIPTIVDITGSTFYITDANMRDELSTLGVQNHGFKPFPYNVHYGDGVGGGNVPGSEFFDGNIGARTLTEALATLAGNGYSKGDIVNSGYAKTLKIIEHRNKILNNGVVMIPANDELGTPEDRLGPLEIPHATSGQTELQNLVSLMGNLRQYMASHFSETNVAKWTQLYYPAASAAYAYQPSVPSNFVLADKFKAHNWFLPPEGILDRIHWYLKKGADSELNIFRKALAAGLFVNFSSSYYWSSTEYSGSYAWNVYFGGTFSGGSNNYYSNAVRAVAAF